MAGLLMNKLEEYLTRRILELRAQGFSADQIAERLGAVAESKKSYVS
jgi:hypothetical protein